MHHLNYGCVATGEFSALPRLPGANNATEGALPARKAVLSGDAPGTFCQEMI
jgi:hypothetical protein